MQALAGHGKASFLCYLWDEGPLSYFEQRSDKMWINILKGSSGWLLHGKQVVGDHGESKGTSFLQWPMEEMMVVCYGKQSGSSFKNWKQNYQVIQQSYSWAYNWKRQKLIWKVTCTPMFIAALFTIAKLWKPHGNNPNVHRQMNG